MEKMDKNGVHAAFEILVKEIEAVINALNESGAETLRAGEYEQARSTIEEAKRLANFREKVKALQREWATFPVREAKPRENKATHRTKGRLPRGLRTPVEAFRRPILEALVELGGSAPIGEVLDRVGAKMEAVLNSYDREPLPSDPRTVRWRNTAQWCRKALVSEGLMRSDSPYGIWEISDAGRKWLEDEGSQL